MLNDIYFPLYFIIERVNNGFILTSKNSQSNDVIKEIVTEDKIKTRLGEILAPESLTKGSVYRYYINSIPLVKDTNTESPANFQSDDEVFDAKIMFYNIRNSETTDNSILGIVDKDKNCIEIMGQNALDISKTNNIAIARKNGIPIISFANDKEGRIALSKCAHKIKLIEYNLKDLLDWYKKHKRP